MIKLEHCPICKETEWHELDYMRNQKYWYEKDMREEDEPVGFKACKNCGFVTYDYIEDLRLQEFYDRQRPSMSPLNIVTCNRKNEYHFHFLKDELSLLKPDANILDVGCAQGSFLNALKEYGFKNLYGTEYSKAFASFGKNEYGLNITDEIDETKKYDFISYYHVLEHIQNPDKELRIVSNVLNDNGLLYISVPDYMDMLEEKGGSTTNDFENYYHLNHVNCFTFKSFRNLLNVSGFEIIKEDTYLYGYTVLCKKAEKKPIEKENYLEKTSILEMQKKAIDLLLDKKYEDAYKLYPKYPDAYIFNSLSKESMKEFEPQIEILTEGLKNCPNNYRIENQLAKVYFQWDENTPEKQFYSNNVKKAESIFLNCFTNKPGAEENLYFLALIEARYKNDYDKAVEYIREFMRINPMKFQEGYNLISNFWKAKAIDEKFDISKQYVPQNNPCPNP